LSGTARQKSNERGRRTRISAARMQLRARAARASWPARGFRVSRRWGATRCRPRRPRVSAGRPCPGPRPARRDRHHGLVTAGARHSGSAASFADTAARIGAVSAFQVLRRGLLVVGRHVAEEELAVRRHFLQRPGPLLLRLGHRRDLGHVTRHQPSARAVASGSWRGAAASSGACAAGWSTASCPGSAPTPTC